MQFKCGAGGNCYEYQNKYRIKPGTSLEAEINTADLFCPCFVCKHTGENKKKNIFVVQVNWFIN